MELIETLWNVNEAGLKVRISIRFELIETLWNVNAINIFFCVIEHIKELIETLWNVNLSVKARQTSPKKN